MRTRFFAIVGLALVVAGCVSLSRTPEARFFVLRSVVVDLGLEVAVLDRRAVHLADRGLLLRELCGQHLLAPERRVIVGLGLLQDADFSLQVY